MIIDKDGEPQKLPENKSLIISRTDEQYFIKNVSISSLRDEITFFYQGWGTPEIAKNKSLIISRTDEQYFIKNVSISSLLDEITFFYHGWGTPEIAKNKTTYM